MRIWSLALLVLISACSDPPPLSRSSIGGFTGAPFGGAPGVAGGSGSSTGGTQDSGGSVSRGGDGGIATESGGSGGSSSGGSETGGFPETGGTSTGGSATGGMPATGGDSTGGASTGGDGTGGTISVTPDGRCDFIATCAGTPGTCTIVLNGYPCGHCQTVGFSCYSGNFQGYYFSDGTTYRCDSSGCLKAATSMANHCKSAACN